MTESSTIQYIIFTYAVGPEDTEGPPVALLTLSPHPDGTGKLAVYVAPNWEESVEACERVQLTRDVLQDWKQIDPTETVPVFQDLLQAFNGPLRAHESGTCSSEKLQEILKQDFVLSPPGS